MCNSNNCSEFLHYLFFKYSETVDETGFAENYLSWKSIHKDELNGDNMLAIITLSECFTKSDDISFPSEKDYWARQTPIDLMKYPNCISKVYRHISSGNLYLVYRELGGHVPELRCRLIQRNLLTPLPTV